MNEIEIEIAYFIDCPKTQKKYWLFLCSKCAHYRNRIVGGQHGRVECDYNG